MAIGRQPDDMDCHQIPQICASYEARIACNFLIIAPY